METTRRVRIGNLFIPSGFASQIEEITARLTRDPAFIENHRDRLTKEMRDALIAALQVMIPEVRHIRLTFTLKAGCTMCPCSPGFSVSGVIMDTRTGNSLLTPALRGYPGIERAVFYLDKSGALEGRTQEVRWTRGPRGLREYREYQQKPVMSVRIRAVSAKAA